MNGGERMRMGVKKRVDQKDETEGDKRIDSVEDKKIRNRRKKERHKVRE